MSAHGEKGDAVRIGMLDIDSTLTGDPETADRVRVLLNERGYLVVFNTSRTEEMVMSRRSYDASRALGWFRRPPPHLGHEGDRRVDVPQEESEPVGLLDPDVIAGSTGTRILVRQADGAYLPDESYGAEEPLQPGEWRQSVFALVEEINGEGAVAEPAAIEYAENYEAGISDVYPPDYRMQLNFGHPADRIETEMRLRRLGVGGAGPLSPMARRVRLFDDSEPREGRYKGFIVPRWASKARAARHIVRRLCRDVGSRPQVLFVGDSYPDLHMALVGGVGLGATFLLVGQSRLADVLWGPETNTFAGTSLRAVRRRLSHTDRPGQLRYRVPGRQGGDLTVIVGDGAFPGAAAAQTVERYLLSLPD